MNQLAQETDGQKVFTLRFLFEDDLSQDRAGDIVARFRINDDKVVTPL